MRLLLSSKVCTPCYATTKLHVTISVGELVGIREKQMRSRWTSASLMNTTTLEKTRAGSRHLISGGESLHGKGHDRMRDAAFDFRTTHGTTPRHHVVSHCALTSRAAEKPQYGRDVKRRCAPDW